MTQILNFSKILIYLNLITLRVAVDGNCTSLCYFVEGSGNFLPAIQHKLSDPSSKFNTIIYWTLQNGK
jgi:hypothetical protein